MDPFKVLGVPPTASEDDIKKAYKELTKKYHPDKNGGDVYAEIVMTEINKAYRDIKRNFVTSSNDEPKEKGKEYSSLPRYNVDLVYCVDVSSNMATHIERVKKELCAWPHIIETIIEKRDRILNKMRIRLICFSDYLTDSEAAIMVTDFFDYQKEKAEYENIVSGINLQGGFGFRKCGLEALAYAIGSNWEDEPGCRHRHNITLWTNGGTRALGLSIPSYPSKMPKSLDELNTQWQRIASRCWTTLLLLAPNQDAWEEIINSWQNVLLFPSNAGERLQGLELNEILEAIIEGD